MTVDKIIERLETLGLPDNTCREHIKTDLRALIRTESERAGDLIDAEAIAAHKSGDGESIYYLRNVRDKILRTSPGKGGG